MSDTATATRDKTAAPARSAPPVETVAADPFLPLSAGHLVQLLDERWFRCEDPKIGLNGRLSAVAVVLEDCKIDPVRGAAPGDIRTFTIRQFYQDGHNSDCLNKDFTDQNLGERLADIQKHLGLDARRKMETVLMPALKQLKGIWPNEI